MFIGGREVGDPLVSLLLAKSACPKNHALLFWHDPTVDKSEYIVW